MGIECTHTIYVGTPITCTSYQLCSIIQHTTRFRSLLGLHQATIRIVPRSSIDRDRYTMEDSALPLSANKIISLITNAAHSSDDIAYIQRKLAAADVGIDIAMGCLASHLTERMHSLLLKNTQGRSTHEQRDTLKQQACVLGRLAQTVGDVDLVSSLLSSLRVCDVARSLLANNRSVELHFFIQWLCVLLAPMQGQLHDCSGTRSDLYDLYTETNLRYRLCV